MQRRNASTSEVSTLKIDRDCFVDQDWIENYVRTILMICSMFHVTVESIRMCRSKRKGNHFYISIDPPVEANVANQLQWLLGDDDLRVDRNRARIQAGFDPWNKLFERLDARLRTIYRPVTS